MSGEENQVIQVIQVWGLEEHRPVIVVIWFLENIITHYYPVSRLPRILSPFVSTFPLPISQHWTWSNISLAISLSDNITCNIPAI